MSKQKINNNQEQEFSLPLCESKHVLVETQFEHTNELISELKKNIENINSTTKTNEDKQQALKENMKDRIFVTKETILSKIDTISKRIDDNEESNEKIAEKISYIWLVAKILLGIFILLVGGEIAGVGIADVKNFLSSHKHVTAPPSIHKNVNTNVDTNDTEMSQP